LSGTLAGFLVSDKPVDVQSAQIPGLKYSPLLPIDDAIMHLSQLAPSTEAEALMQTALLNMIDRDQAQDLTVQALTAQLALQAHYCMKVWTQLAAKEKKGQEKSGQLLGNGLPAVLTSNNFHAQVVEQGKAAQEEQARKEAIANAKREHKERIAKWKTVDWMRIKQNKERLEEWRASHEA
ncbi:hypothetical protein B0J17DRAFT_581889, partial [Rhizoctonia solani]